MRVMVRRPGQSTQAVAISRNSRNQNCESPRYSIRMKLSDWAHANGISYTTAWLWWKRGKLPVPAYQTPTGTILVEVPERKDAGAVLFARVSSADQKADLDRQVARLAAFAAENGI